MATSEPAASSLSAGEQWSDEEVVLRILAGDTALFEILMRRHNQRIYRAVRAVLRSDDDVEDVMQQAYLKAYRHLRQFAGASRFSTWLTRIAVNEALDRRNTRSGRSGDEDTMVDLIQSSDPGPERRAYASELREVLQREVEALPDAFRTVLVLRDVEGMSTAETAACLDVSEDLVKTRLHRARSLLRDSLERSAGLTLRSVFGFGNERCDRVVTAVMARIGAGD